jgi:hypothetical protein
MIYKYIPLYLSWFILYNHIIISKITNSIPFYRPVNHFAGKQIQETKPPQIARAALFGTGVNGSDFDFIIFTSIEH